MTVSKSHSVLVDMQTSIQRPFLTGLGNKWAHYTLTIPENGFAKILASVTCIRDLVLLTLWVRNL